MISIYQKTDPKGGIWGRVIDSDTQKGIPNASIRLPGIGRDVRSDEDGFYLVTGLDAGSYSVMASHEKYNSSSDLLEVASEMVYKDFIIDKNKDNGGKEDKYLIYGQVEAVEQGNKIKAKKAEVAIDPSNKGIADSYGYYVIDDLDGENKYDLTASYPGFSSKKVEASIENTDIEVNFTLYAGFTIDVVGKTGNKEHYRYTIQTSRSADKFSVTSLPVKDYKIDGPDTIEIDPATHIEGKDVVFNYKYNMADIKIEAVYKDGDNETVIGEFSDIAEIDTMYKWTKTTPTIDGYTYNSMYDAIKVKESGNTFKLYYVKSSGNLKINAVEKLSDGSLSTIGSIVIPIKKGDKYQAIDTNALTIDKIGNLRYYDLVKGKGYIGSEGTTEFKYEGIGSIPEVFYLYEKITEKITIKAIDIKTDKELDVLMPEMEVKIEENVNISAPELKGDLGKDYRLVGDNQKVVHVKHNEKDKVVKFYYERIERELADISIQLFYEENGIKLPMFSYTIPGEVDKEIKIDAPVMKGWTIKDQSPKTITPKAGEKNEVEFVYVKDELLINLKLVSNENGTEKDISNLLPQGAKTSYKVLRGSDYTVFAPQILGYVLVKDQVSFKELKNIEENKEIKFVYQPISDVVDEHVVSINVKGTDENGDQIYAYSVNRPKGSGDYTVKAFKQLGYEHDGEEQKTVKVEDKELYVEFKYKSLERPVTIKAVDENNQPIEDFTEIKVKATKGKDFSYNAPYIKGWNLNDSITKVIAVNDTNNEITFKYKKADGNVEIILREDNGRMIQSLSDTVQIGGEKTITAPPLTKDNYSLKGPAEIKVEYSEERQTIEFIYTKDTRDIKVNHYDISIDGQEKLIDKASYTLEKQRVGEVVEVSAKNIDNYYLVSELNKLVKVEKGTDPQEVRFNYKSTDEEKIVVNAVENGTNRLLQSTDLDVNKGSVLKINAPEFDTHKLAAGELNPKVARSGDIVTFKYDKNTVEVTVEAKDNKGTKLELPVGVEGKFEAVKGKDFIAYAPYIPGYVLKDKDKQAIKFDKIGKNEIAVFEYIPISEVVDEYTVSINVKGIDEDGNQIYAYSVNRPKGSGDYTVKAFKQLGYEHDGEEQKTVKVEDKELYVEFKYKSLERPVTIKAVDENNQAIEDFTEIKVKATKGKDFSYNAPYIKGWNLNDSITKVITVNDTNNEITFKYKKADGNVEIILREDNGRMIQSLSDTVQIGGEKTIAAPPLTKDNYSLKGPAEIKVEYSEERQTIEFIYTKDTRDIKVNHYDISIDGQEKLIDKASYTLEKQRVGEVVEVSAKNIDNYYLASELNILVKVETVTDPQEVRFNYKSTDEEKIVVNAVENGTNRLLQSTDLDVNKGSVLKINAPEFDTHKLAAGELNPKVGRSGDIITFKYDKNTVKVTIEAKDPKGNKVDLPVGVEANLKQ